MECNRTSFYAFFCLDFCFVCYVQLRMWNVVGPPTCLAPNLSTPVQALMVFALRMG